jgi:hypothetical protein
MSQHLILYRDWACLRFSQGLGAEGSDQCTLKDIKESLKLVTKLESDVLKFDSKDWLKWFKSIDNYFRRMLSMQGVTLDWVY